MSFAQLYWNNSDKKMEKTKITEKNELLEKNIERNMNIKTILDENNIFNSFPKNKDKYKYDKFQRKYRNKFRRET